MTKKSFTLSVSAFRAKTEKQLDQLIRKLVLDLFTSVVMATPVDTGRARGNWVVGIGSKPSGSGDLAPDPSGAATIAKITSAIVGAKQPKEIWLLNSVPYILRLEYGWSKQAPSGMVRLSILNMKNAISAAGGGK